MAQVTYRCPDCGRKTKQDASLDGKIWCTRIISHKRRTSVPFKRVK